MHFVKEYLLNNNISVCTFSNEVGFSKDYIYEVFSGKKSFSDGLFNKVLMKYSLTYCDEYSFYDESLNFVIHLFEAIVSMDKSLFLNVYQNYAEQRLKLISSYGFVFDEMIDAMHCIINGDKDNCRVLLQDCCRKLPCFNDTAAYIYLIVFCLTHYINKDYSIIKNELNYISRNYSLEETSSAVKGMYYYRWGLLYDYEIDYIKSYQYYQMAKDAFKDIYCLQRSLLCDIQMCSIYAYIGQYDQAITSINKTISICIRNKYTRIITSCYHNLIYFKMLNRQYDELFEIISAYKTIDATRDRILLYEVIYLYKTNAIHECKDAIYKFRYHHSNKYINQFLKLIDGLITNNDSKIDSNLNYLIQYNVKDNDVIEIKLIYQLVLDHYQLHDNKVLYYKNLERYTKILNLI